MVTIKVQGHGEYVIHSSKLNELLGWLQNNSMPVEAKVRPLKDGETLLNG